MSGAHHRRPARQARTPDRRAARLVSAGRRKKTLASDVAVEKDKELSAIQRIWSTWADHAPELREMWPEIKRRRLERKMREQNAPHHRRPTGQDWVEGTTPELEKHPAVAEARAAFPGQPCPTAPSEAGRRPRRHRGGRRVMLHYLGVFLLGFSIGTLAMIWA